MKEEIFKAYDIRGIYPEEIDEDIDRIAHGIKMKVPDMLRDRGP